ncbi:MAG: 4a-hydroxytetrahydrobiopterin dehydratase [Patescibacteria group bacterium]
MTTSLEQKHCRACELGEGKLNHADIEAFMTHTPQWTVVKDHEIFRDFKFKNFAEALAFVNKVGALAESEGHHPDVSFGWGYVKITLSTHAVDGLSENDFILAVKIDTLENSR